MPFVSPRRVRHQRYGKRDMMTTTNEIQILPVLQREGDPCRVCGEGFKGDKPNLAHFHAVCLRCQNRIVHVVYYDDLPEGAKAFEAAQLAFANTSCPDCGLTRVGNDRQMMALGSNLVVNPHLEVEAMDLVEAADVPPVDSLWGPWHARGESLLVYAPTGAGKTTLAMRYCRSALRVDKPELLDAEVREQERILYLMVDRAPQQRRFLARMWSPDEREVHKGRFLSWAGPLPLDVEREPWKLVEFCHKVGKAPSLVVIDVIEGVVSGVYGAEGAGRYARARDALISHDVDLLELHHMKKAQGQQVGRKPTTLDRVYGGRQLPDLAGGIIMLWQASPDAPVIDLNTYKSPIGKYPFLKIAFDRERHEMEVDQDVTSLMSPADRREHILIVIGEEPLGMTFADIRSFSLGVGDRTLRRDIADLLEAGRLTIIEDSSPETYLVKEDA